MKGNVSQSSPNTSGENAMPEIPDGDVIRCLFVQLTKGDSDSTGEVSTPTSSREDFLAVRMTPFSDLSPFSRVCLPREIIAKSPACPANCDYVRCPGHFLRTTRRALRFRQRVSGKRFSTFSPHRGERWSSRPQA